MEAGKPHDIRPIAPCEARRIEAGIFNYNSDMTIANNPFEIMGLERLVEPQDGRLHRQGGARGDPGQGRQPQARRHRGRRAMRSRSRSPRSGRRSTRARRSGHITDLIWSPRLEKNIGYVWVPIELSAPGIPLEIDNPDGSRWAGPDRGDPVPRREEGHPEGMTTSPGLLTDAEIAAVRQPYRAARLLPGRAYHDPAFYAFERERFFGRDWQIVGRDEDVPAPGSYILATIDDEPLIVLRGRDGIVRAFYNVCQHRGTAVAEEPCGTVVRLQCPYHAWIYDLEGNLVRAKHTDDLAEFDFGSYGLRPVRLATWGGFLFATLAEEGPSLEDQLGDLVDHFARFDLASLRSARSATYEVDSNWKFIAENYSECYHCPGIHPQLNRLTPYDLGGDFNTNGEWQGGWMELVADAETMALEGGHRDGRPPMRGATELDERRIVYYLVWPNLVPVAPPGLRARPQADAGRSRPHQDRVLVALRARDDRPAGLRPDRRGRLLGPDQPPGLARLRAPAARHASHARGYPGATRTSSRRSTRSTSWSSTAMPMTGSSRRGPCATATTCRPRTSRAGRPAPATSPSCPPRRAAPTPARSPAAADRRRGGARQSPDVAVHRFGRLAGGARLVQGHVLDDVEAHLRDLARRDIGSDLRRGIDRSGDAGQAHIVAEAIGDFRVPPRGRAGSCRESRCDRCRRRTWRSPRRLRPGCCR